MNTHIAAQGVSKTPTVRSAIGEYARKLAAGWSKLLARLSQRGETTLERSAEHLAQMYRLRRML